MASGNAFFYTFRISLDPRWSFTEIWHWKVLNNYYPIKINLDAKLFCTMNWKQVVYIAKYTGKNMNQFLMR